MDLLICENGSTVDDDDISVYFTGVHAVRAITLAKQQQDQQDQDNSDEETRDA